MKTNINNTFIHHSLLIQLIDRDDGKKKKQSMA